VIWLRGWDLLKDFRFGPKRSDHKFCPDCGSSMVIDPCYGYTTVEKFKNAPDAIGLNVRMIKGVDLSKLHFSIEGLNSILQS